MKIKSNIQVFSKNMNNMFNNIKSTTKKFTLQPMLTKYNFTSKLFSAENLKFQKTFKFTKNSEKIKEITSREKYQENLKKIRELDQQIKEEERLMYTSAGEKGGAVAGMTVMRREKDDQMDEVDFDKEDLKPVNISHKNKRNELKEKRRSLINENESIKLKYLTLGKSCVKSATREEYGYMRYSLIKDVFSNSFSFNNRLLNPEYFETVNKIEDEKPWAVKQDEQEVISKQTNLENEISNVLDDMINKDMNIFDVYNTAIPHTLGAKPLVRSIPVDVNQPPSLLVEGDLNVNYDVSLEFERLLRLTKNDDFGQKIKEDQDKEEEREEIQEEEKDFLNEGNQPNTLSIDPSLSSLTK